MAKRNGHSNGNGKTTCSRCGEAGGNGAEWLLIVNGGAPERVHRPCGKELERTAPQGVKVELRPSRTLREKWKADKRNRDFWEQKLAEAKPLAKGKGEVV